MSIFFLIGAKERLKRYSSIAEFKKKFSEGNPQIAKRMEKSVPLNMDCCMNLLLQKV